jgi:hypothetical protein
MKTQLQEPGHLLSAILRKARRSILVTQCVGQAGSGGLCTLLPLQRHRRCWRRRGGFSVGKEAQ